MVRHASMALLLLALPACLRPSTYACSDADQCRVGEGGACVDGWCAYSDIDCPSGLRFGEFAAGSLAQGCVDAGVDSGGAESGDVATTVSDADSGATSDSGDDGPDAPVSRCGNGIIDGGETCDDGNREAGDGCHPQCVEPGTALWTVTYDGEAHGDDRGFGVAIDPDGESFWVSGYTTVHASNGSDLLLQRRWIEDGSLVWTRSHDGDAHGDDLGEEVALDASGRPWLVGQIRTVAGGGDVWLGSFARDGSPGPAFIHDEQGGEDHGHGIEITAGGTILVTGMVELDTGGTPDVAAWIRRHDASGAALGPAIVRNGGPALDTALQVVADGEGFVVVGNLSTPDGVEEPWTARYDGADGLVWEDLGTAENVGPFPRGVGVAADPNGGWVTAGVLSADIWVRRYAEDGAVVDTMDLDGPRGRHDEAAGVAFLGDGRYIVVGFVDFGTVGFATSDTWVRMHAVDGTPEWTDVFEGAAEEIDKALAVGVTDLHSAIVVGYETVPGQSRDVWMRHYAL